MRTTTGTDVNVKLLAMFDAVWRTRSISRAAEELGMTQPGVSIGLGKLRRHFGDLLFVRSASGMHPTAHAQHVAPLVQQALSLVAEALDYKAAFDPATTTRTFRICMTDVTQILALSSVLQRFADTAPDAVVEVKRLQPDTPLALARGDADVAIGLLPGLGAEYREQTLMRRSFACIVSPSHPRIGKSMTRQQFDEEQHVVVQAGGTGLALAEKFLARHPGQHNVRVRVPDFVGLGQLIYGTELVATVPREVGERMALQGTCRVVDHPLRLPTYMVKLYWHQRFNREPGSVWLRGLLRELLAPRPK